MYYMHFRQARCQSGQNGSSPLRIADRNGPMLGCSSLTGFNINMTDHKVSGSCLCNLVRYEITGNLGIFQYCHCSRCRKFTGSAHAANLLVSPGDFSWLSGAEHVGRYEPENTKHFATSFCKHCGSSMPWLGKSGKAVVIPAGTLDNDPAIKPMQNIFCGSRAIWYKSADSLPESEELP